jgi:hypothetical protein
VAEWDFRRPKIRRIDHSEPRRYLASSIAAILQ